MLCCQPFFGFDLSDASFTPLPDDDLIIEEKDITRLKVVSYVVSRTTIIDMVISVANRDLCMSSKIKLTVRII